MTVKKAALKRGTAQRARKAATMTPAPPTTERSSTESVLIAGELCGCEDTGSPAVETDLLIAIASR